MFAAVCILLGVTATKHHYTNISMLYVSNKYLHAKNLHVLVSVPRQKNSRSRPGESPVITAAASRLEAGLTKEFPQQTRGEGPRTKRMNSKLGE